MLCTAVMAVTNNIHWVLNWAVFFLFVCLLWHSRLKKSKSNESCRVKDEHEKDIFPMFDSDILMAYRDYKAKYKSLSLSSFVRVLVYLIFVHSLISTIDKRHDILSIACSMALVFIKFIVIALILSSAIVAVLESRDLIRVSEQSQRLGKYLRENVLNGNLEELIAVSLVTWLGLCLYAQIDSSVLSIVQPNSCNQLPALPADHIMFNIFFIVGAPLGFRRMRFTVAISLWIIGVVFLIASLIRVGGNFEWFTVAVYFIPLTFIFEHERSTRLSFLHVQLAKQQSEILVEVIFILACVLPHIYQHIATDC